MTVARFAVSFDPELARGFRLMRELRLLDLANRKGKAPGGYQSTLSESRLPFIFMNAAGTQEDVMTLLHEAGHSFHAFASHPLPYIWQRHPTMEQAELASMSMELLAFEGLRKERGGFYDEAEWSRARREHLEDVLLTLAHVASVDAFQSWIYTSGEGHDAAARDAAWLRIRSRFERGAILPSEQRPARQAPRLEKLRRNGVRATMRFGHLWSRSFVWN